MAAHAACSATNGDPIPSQVYDASVLDAGGNPEDPEPEVDGGRGVDGSTKKDAATDAPVDAKDAAPNSAPVQINEIFVDNDALGDGAEFIELRAAPGTRADDLKLRIVYTNGLVTYEVTVGAAGETFNGNGLWVVGGPQVFKVGVPSHVDRQVSINDWGLDNERGTIQVVRGTTLLDVVGYARTPDSGALAPLALPPTATVEGKVATVPIAPTTTPAISRKHRSFGRKNAAADTGDNATDFCPMEASPGFVQKACLL